MIDDGDQTTTKILWTQEANEDAEKFMNTPAFFVNYSGAFVRYIELEAMQTFYNMTKEPNSKNRTSALLQVLYIVRKLRNSLQRTQVYS